MAIVVICGIWIEGINEVYWKLIGTGFVILALAGFLHAVFNGMDSTTKNTQNPTSRGNQ